MQIIKTILQIVLFTLFVFSTLVKAQTPTSLSEFNEQLTALEDNLSITPQDALAEAELLIAAAKENNWSKGYIEASTLKVETLLGLEQLQSTQQLILQLLPLTDSDELVEANVRLLLAQLQINHIQNRSTTDILENIYSKLTAITDPKMLGSIYSVLANQFFDKGQTEQAVTYHNLARKQFEQIDFKVGLASTLNGLANIYSSESEYKKAIEYLQEALEVMRELGNRFSESIVLFNLAHNYMAMEQYEQAQTAFSDSLTISNELNDIAGQAWTKKALGGLYESQENFEKALLYYDQSLSFFRENLDKRNIMNIQFGRVNSMIELKQVEDAEVELAELEEMIDELDEEDNEFSAGLKRQKAKLAAAKGDHKTAFELQTEVTKELQKIHEKSGRKNLEELLVQYDMEKKENDNRLLQQENELKELKLQQQQREGFLWRLAMAFAVLVLILVGYLLQRILVNRNHFQQMALKDHLTDAPNRRAILHFAERHFQLSRRNRQPFTLAILDLDFFKRINDSFGHDAGDEVLKAIAQAIKSSIRTQDSFGRYGGEEWLLVLNNANKEDVEVIFARIKENLASIRVDNIPDDYKITFSLGASQIQKGDMSLNSVIKRADECLYKAKEGGRDRYVIEP